MRSTVVGRLFRQSIGVAHRHLRQPQLPRIAGHVRATDLTAYSHRDLPFDRLVEILNPVRSSSHHPLFQVLLVLLSGGRTSLNLPGLRASHQSLDLNVSRYDLRFGLHERRAGDGTPEGIGGSIGYACDLFDRRSIEIFADRLHRLLQSIVGDVEQRIENIDLLAPAERQQILTDWNATARLLPRNHSAVAVRAAGRKNPGCRRPE